MTLVTKENQMRIPEPGHDKGWGVTFVASLAWAFIGIVALMHLGLSVPILIPIAIFGLGTYTYGLFCKNIDD